MQNNINNSYQKIFKYLIMGLTIYMSAKYIPEHKVNDKELIMLACISSITFAILDMISPSIQAKSSQRHINN
jgi:hypothetical protein